VPYKYRRWHVIEEASRIKINISIAKIAIYFNTQHPEFICEKKIVSWALNIA